MKAITILIISALFVLGISTVNAEVYTWVDENGVRHYSDSPPEEAEDAKVVFPEYQYDESVDKNRTLKDQHEMNALIEEIERESAQDQAEAKKQTQEAEENRPPTQEELVAIEKERLEKKIAFLEKQPLEYFGSQRNKIVRLGYYHYRIRDLMEDPDEYFRQPAPFEGNVKIPDTGHESGGAGH
ncbi:MAG: DUF4124 domain-containing protein [bacterium]|nr:DUF4124 domain-containing protein [bacterium]